MIRIDGTPATARPGKSRRQRRLLVVLGITVVLVAGAAVAATLLFSGSSSPRSGQAPQARGECTVSDQLVPSCGAWWGVAPVPGEGKDLRFALARYEDRIGRRVDLLHVYHRGNELFPTAKEVRLASPEEGRLLLANWRPSDSDSWRDVASGKADPYLKRLARHIARVYPQRFFLSIAAEPEDEVGHGPRNSASDYASMFRHVVEVLRAHGVDNIVTVQDFIGNARWLSKPWFDSLYAGDDVVDWLGYDPFVMAAAAGSNADGPLAALLGSSSSQSRQGFLGWARTTAPRKPIMLAEWGVFGEQGKSDVFRSLASAPRLFPEIKAWSYWENEASFQRDQGDVANATTVNNPPAALAAYRAAGEMPYFRTPTRPAFRTP